MVINGLCHCRLYLLVTLLFLVLLSVAGCDEASQQSQASDPSCLTARQAMTSVGKTACVEFYVGNPSQLKGEVFLNELADYTKGFQAVILSDSIAKFKDPVSQYRAKTIRVSGLIIEYDGHPGIIVKDPSDIIIIK
jgi:hypothetical protein